METYYIFKTKKGEYKIGCSSYECLSGPHKGYGIYEDGGPGPNYGGMVNQIIMLENYGPWKDEDQIHPYNARANRRFKRKGSGEIEIMKEGYYYCHTGDVRDIVWWETYAEWVDRECKFKKEDK